MLGVPEDRRSELREAANLMVAASDPRFMTGDDSFEADYGTRNIGFYDNYITNCGTLLGNKSAWKLKIHCRPILQVSRARLD